MATIRIGRFDNFKGANTLLIAADRPGMRSLIGLLQRVQQPGAVPRLDELEGVTVHGDLRIVLEVVELDRGLVVTEPGAIFWRRTPQGWSEIIEKLRALEASPHPAHQFLDGPSDDLQVMAAIGEYDEEWWTARGEPRLPEPGPAVDPADVHGKRLAMLAWDKKPDGSDDVVVYTGVAEWNGQHLTMVRDPGPPFSIQDEWLDRIKPVVDVEMKRTLLNADFVFSVSIGSLPKDANPDEYTSTGLKWPQDPDERGSSDR